MSGSAPALLRLLPAALAALAACSPFRAELPEFKDGIAAYKDSKWADAEKHFDRALAKEPSSEGHFDKGSALAKQQKPQEAAEQFRRALGTRDEALRARSYLDLGNAEAAAGKLDAAIEAYRRSLELVPADADARYNLEWALLQKKKAEQQQKSPDGKDGKEDPQAKDDQKKDEQKDGDKQQDGKQAQQDEQKKDEQKKDGEQQQAGQDPKQDEQQQPKQEGQDQQQQGGAQERQADARPEPGGDPQQAQAQPRAEPPPRPLSRQEVGEILDALEAGEKNLQMWRFQEKPGERRQRAKLDKDW